MERLSPPLHASVRRALRQAWELDNAAKAEKLIRNLAHRLERDAPGVDDEQTRHRWIEAALDQVVDQRLHHSAMLGCPFHQPERVLEALAIDAERRHQNEMLTDVDAVDLHHHDVEPGQIGAHHSFMRAADNATKCREAADLETPAPADAGTSPSGSRVTGISTKASTSEIGRCRAVTGLDATIAYPSACEPRG
jgi:hypothetical protein